MLLFVHISIIDMKLVWDVFGEHSQNHFRNFKIKLLELSYEYEQRYRSHYCFTGFGLGATSVDKRKGKSKTNVHNFE